MRISLSAHLLFLTLRGSDAPLTKDDIPHPIDTRQGGGYFYLLLSGKLQNCRRIQPEAL